MSQADKFTEDEVGHITQPLWGVRVKTTLLTHAVQPATMQVQRPFSDVWAGSVWYETQTWQIIDVWSLKGWYTNLHTQLLCLILAEFHKHNFNFYLKSYLCLVWSSSGEPDVHQLPLGCCWKPGLQKPVLRNNPRRGQGAGVKQETADTNNAPLILPILSQLKFFWQLCELHLCHFPKSPS